MVAMPKHILEFLRRHRSRKIRHAKLLFFRKKIC